ncbi:MAG TPA: hypothetical protein VFI01_04870, partial [Gaiellaceae bacterium]|nr:hypothetical protein [Gaiellaceae bacterium]
GFSLVAVVSECLAEPTTATCLKAGWVAKRVFRQPGFSLVAVVQESLAKSTTATCLKAGCEETCVQATRLQPGCGRFGMRGEVDDCNLPEGRLRMRSVVPECVV